MPLPRQYERVAKGKRLFFFLVESHPDRLDFHHMNIFPKRFSILKQYPLQTMRKVTKLDLIPFCLLYGENCQTGVMTGIGSCCAKTSWNPNLYADRTRRGRCLESQPSLEGGLICLRWEFPNGFNNGLNNGLPGTCGGN
jgi:hypothetical protein